MRTLEEMADSVRGVNVGIKLCDRDYPVSVVRYDAAADSEVGQALDQGWFAQKPYKLALGLNDAEADWYQN